MLRGVGSNFRNVVPNRDAGPVLGKHSLAVLVSLNKSNCFESGPFGCKIESSYAAEQRQVSELHLLLPDRIRDPAQRAGDAEQGQDEGEGAEGEKHQ